MCVFAIYVDSIIFHSDYFEHFSCVVTVVIKVFVIKVFLLFSSKAV